MTPKIFKHPIWKKKAPAFASLLMRAIGSTLRIQFQDKSGIVTSTNQPVIYAFWHNRIFMLPYLYRIFFPETKISILISPSRDGEIITKTIKAFHVDAVRGSTSKKSFTAFRQIFKEITEQQRSIGISPDGPRGPRYKVQLGIISLAQMTGVPIIPVICNHQSKIELRSWDRFQIPYPFTKTTFTFLEPIYIPSESDDQERERLRLHLETVLLQANKSEF